MATLDTGKSGKSVSIHLSPRGEIGGNRCQFIFPQEAREFSLGHKQADDMDLVGFGPTVERG